MKILHTIPAFLTLIFIQNVSTAQNTGMLFQSQEPVTLEKIYLHTDRDFYFLGDTIWYKAYLLDGQSLSLVTDIQNLYIDLIDSQGRNTQNQVLFCENGEASGSIIITDTAATGTFIIRAYTDYLKNFGEEMFFHKTLRISEVKNSFEIESENPDVIEEKPEIDVSFLPEGGYLLSGTLNLIAFKAVDKNGKGFSIEGKVLDSHRDTVSIFRTDYMGMGKLFFIPMKGESYEVKIDGYPGFEYRFMNIRNKTEKLVLLQQSKEELTLGVILNSRKQSREQYIIACFSRDMLLFYKEIVINRSIKVKIETDLMLGGINRFVLLNGELEPLSERLVFLDNMDVNNLEVKTTQKEFATRSPVQLEIFDDKNTTDLDYSTLSVAVVDENALNATRGSQNILSYLLLDSELKRFIESPADYFVDDDNITSQEKLNLLMLTHGWSRYLRNSFKENSVNIEYQKTAGFLIKGRAERSIGKKPIADGSVTLGIFEDNDINWYESKTDSTGYFSFDGMFFFDSATIVAQALNERGKKLSEVFIDTLFEKEPVVSPLLLNTMQAISAIPLQHYRQKYYSDIEYREYHPDEGSVLLEEVEIKAKRVEKDDGHFRFYRRADQILEVTDNDITYGSVLQFLQGRVAGLNIYVDALNTSRNRIYLRGFSSITGDPTPLFLIDGVPMDLNESTIELICSIPMQDIDKVEILKGTSAAVYGSRGANGVIAIYTKRGSDPVERDNYITRTITKRMVGFSSCREFYSPQYTPENTDSSKPDHRTTLYWNPNITTEYGKTELSFFTADDLAYYRIIVEGVTDNGQLCLGSAKFVVNRRNESFIMNSDASYGR